MEYLGDYPDDGQQQADQGLELTFFAYSDPAEAKNADNKRRVRSHVARVSHAKSQHSRSSGKKDKHGSNAIASSSSGMGVTTIESYDLSPDGSVSVEVSLASMSLQSGTGPQISQKPLPTQSQALDGQLGPIEQFLVDHYVNFIIPRRHSPCNHPAHSIDVTLYRQGMTRYWVPFCYSDAALLRGIYLASCRDLTRKERKKGNKPDAEMYEQNALQYKGDCLRSMYEAMPTNEQPVVTDNAIGMALFLAFNEYMAGEVEESKSHIAACDYMVELKGGHHTLGLGGFLSQLIMWFKEELALAVPPKEKGKGKFKK